MKKKIPKIIISTIIFLITICYSYYFRPIVDDELFNYGFANNILNGLIPYKDFNMIIPPLFHYLLAGVLKIFGRKLIIYHAVIALIILLIINICYKKNGKNTFIIYLLLLIYPYTGYNMFCLGLLFLLFYLYDNKKIDKRKKEIIEPVIISMIFLSKQTLGLLVIPSIIFSKNKKKTISIYLISIFTFLLYLVVNGSLLQFLDYCLFGMFDFANKNSNGVGILVIIEILIIIVLTITSFKTKRKDLFFCLIFQVVALPIVDYVHFMISFIPVVYLLLKQFNKNFYVTLFGITLTISFFIVFNLVILTKGDNHLYLGHYQVNNFMKGRVTFRLTEDYVFKAKDYIDEYKDHKPYILGHFSYLIKLNNNIPANKFDIINNGNMGYNGANKYIEELDNYCKDNKCLFILNDSESDIVDIQTNEDILNYVKENYRAVYNSNTFSVYIN